MNQSGVHDVTVLLLLLRYLELFNKRILRCLILRLISSLAFLWMFLYTDTDTTKNRKQWQFYLYFSTNHTLFVLLEVPFSCNLPLLGCICWPQVKNVPVPLWWVTYVTRHFEQVDFSKDDEILGFKRWNPPTSRAHLPLKIPVTTRIMTFLVGNTGIPNELYSRLFLMSGVDPTYICIKLGNKGNVHQAAQTFMSLIIYIIKAFLLFTTTQKTKHKILENDGFQIQFLRISLHPKD